MATIKDDLIVDGIIKKVNGTNLQFLKADGSLDSNVYAFDSTTYTKTQIDTTFLGYYTKTQSDSALSLKADSASVYTKTQSDSNYYSKTAIDNSFTNYYLKSQSDSKYLPFVNNGTTEKWGAVSIGGQTGTAYLEWYRGGSQSRSLNVYTIDDAGNPVVSGGFSNAGIYELGQPLSAKYAPMAGYNKTNWDTAYSWGNHASAGYALSSALASGLAVKQASLNGTGLVRMSGTTVSYDNANYALSESLSAYALTSHSHQWQDINGGLSVDISSTDLNNLTTTGFFRGSVLTNCPSGSSWWFIQVEGHSGVWIKQTARGFGGSCGFPDTYTRTKSDNIWGSWEKIWSSSNFTPSNYAPAIHDHNSLVVNDIRDQDPFTVANGRNNRIGIGFSNLAGLGRGWDTLLDIKGWNGNYITGQLAFASTDNALLSTALKNKIYYRTSNATSNGFNSWVQLISSDDISAYALLSNTYDKSTIDSAFNNTYTKSISDGKYLKLADTQTFTASGLYDSVNLNTKTDQSFVGSAYATSNSPFNGGSSWVNLINIRHRGGANTSDGTVYGGQIAMGMTDNYGEIHFRHQVAGTSSWYGWNRIWNSSNFNPSNIPSTNIDAGTAIALNGVNINTVHTSGKYKCFPGCLNLPEATGGVGTNAYWFYLDVIAHDASNWCTQTAIIYGGDNSSSNFLSGTKWQRQHYSLGGSLYWTPWTIVSITSNWTVAGNSYLAPVSSKIDPSGRVIFKGFLAFPGGYSIGQSLGFLNTTFRPNEQVRVGDGMATINIGTSGEVTIAQTIGTQSGVYMASCSFTSLAQAISA